MKSRIGGIVAGCLLLLVILLAAGAGYEAMERRRERARLPQVGRSVDVGGRSLNIACAGEGAPAVVLESDAMRPGYSWVGVARELAAVTRTCWYDRAGYGWSDPAPAPHTSAGSARDLHELLRTAGIGPPYVVAGDGFGTLNVRVYRGMYGNEVVGAVLVDPIVENEEQMGIAGRIPFHLGYPSGAALTWMERVGMMRLLARGGRRPGISGSLTEAERATLAGLERLPSLKAAFLAEQGFTSALEEVRAAGSMGDLPLVVLRSVEAPTSWRPLSGRERESVVTGSRRDVLVEAPEAIVAALRELIIELR